MKIRNRMILILALMALFIVACGSSDPADLVEDAANAVGEVADQVAENASEVAEQAEAVVEDVVEEVTNAVVDNLECTDAIGCVTVAAGDPIRLASALVVTGPNESLGLDSQYGVEIAIADRGEILGHAVELQPEDDGCSAEGGQTAGQKIVSDPSIAGVIGTSCSGAGVPMSQIVCDAGIVMVSPSNTAPVLTEEGSRQNCYFRTAHNDKIQGAAMATYVFEELGITKAAAIHDGDPYTEGLASVFRDSFTEMGGEIVAFEAEASDATNVEPLLTTVAAAGPELIYYPVFIPLGAQITKTSQEIDGLEGVILAAADGVLSPDFIDATGDAAEGMYMSGPDLGFGNTIYDTFLATYMSEYGTEPTAPFHAHAYDATNMILDAIAAVAQVDGDGNMLIGRQDLIDQVGSTSGMSGITGTLTCDANGDCADARIAVNQVQSGEFVPVAGAADTMDGDAMAPDMVECTDAIGCVEVAAGDPIRLASALVVTGPNESLGLDSQYGVEIAIADRGEIMGHAIELQPEDDGCSAEGGQTAGQKVVSDPTIAGVIGTSCSGAGVPMSQIVCDAGIVMVSPSNTAPVLTDEGSRQSCYFRTAHNDKIQGKAMADFVFNELGITKAAAIHDGDPYTEGLATVFRDSFIANGGEIVAFEAEASDATNVEPLLTTVAAAGPELIYYPVFIPLGAQITKTAQEIDGLEGVILAAADGVLSPDFIDASGDAAEGMYMSGPDLGFGNSIYETFLATYLSEYGTEPTAPFHAHAYDATNMILDAIAAVAQMDADGNMLIGRQALIDQVGSTSGMAGITGTLTCDENGDCADARIAVNQVQGGEFVPVAGAADAMMDDGMMEASCNEDLTGETIVLHQQAGREGPLAAILGDGFALATNDIVEYLNDHGGICGATVEVEFCETNYNPELEVQCYTGFVESDPKPVIVFTYGSGATVALKDRVTEDQVINFAAGLNAEAFYNPANGYTFGAAPIYPDQFAGFIQFLSDNWADVKPAAAGDDIVVGVVGWANSFGAGATTPEAIAFAESLGVTVLPLEEQAIAPDADVSGALQNLLLGGANVIYSQNLSFGTTQVIGTVRALGVWDDVIVGGVNWSMNTDVLSFLGENTAAANGYYGVFPYLWWDDVDNSTVALATELFEAGDYGPDARNTTYLTTMSSFINAKTLLEAAINEVGYANLDGAAVLAAMEAAGTTSDGVLTIDATDGRRATSQSQIRQWQWNGESMDYVVIQDWTELPDMRP